MCKTRALSLFTVVYPGLRASRAMALVVAQEPRNTSDIHFLGRPSQESDTRKSIFRAGFKTAPENDYFFQLVAQ